MPYATRLAVEADLDAVARIYSHAVETSISTFDLEPPDRAYWLARLDGQHPGDHLIVAVDTDDDDHVVGYAYSWSYRPRPAYEMTRETSIYLDESVRGRGVGKVLYQALLETLSISGVHTAVALVALPNAASERLHRACGFEEVGKLSQVGWKFGQWIDVKWFQRMLVNLPLTGVAVIDEAEQTPDAG